MPDPAELRDFLKANCTVVAPGETLVVRAPDLTPNQMREFHEVLNYADEQGPYLPFRTVLVPGDGLGVVSEAELRTALRDLVREEIAAEMKRQQHARMTNPGIVVHRSPL